MASLADLFNPSFLMFLGILVLVVALLVVYFESKMREQNHKIASMLSLVSTLAEDMNGVKMGLNHLAIRGGNSFQQQVPINFEENLGNKLLKKELIEVSDDEDSDNEESHNKESDNEDPDNEESDNESQESDENDKNSESVVVEDDIDICDNESQNDISNLRIHEKDNIKVLKLNISNEEDDNEDTNFDLEEPVDLECDFETGDELPEIRGDYVNEVLDLNYNTEDIKEEQTLEEHKEVNTLTSLDLKTISINLGEENHTSEENIDYKKLQIQKLRSIVVEKGLVSNPEASKLKKPELLKLLGVE
jgi:hypothetical protein